MRLDVNRVVRCCTYSGKCQDFQCTVVTFGVHSCALAEYIQLQITGIENTSGKQFGAGRWIELRKRLESCGSDRKSRTTVHTLSKWLLHRRAVQSQELSGQTWSIEEQFKRNARSSYSRFGRSPVLLHGAGGQRSSRHQQNGQAVQMPVEWRGDRESDDGL